MVVEVDDGAVILEVGAFDPDGSEDAVIDAASQLDGSAGWKPDRDDMCSIGEELARLIESSGFSDEVDDFIWSKVNGGLLERAVGNVFERRQAEGGM